MESWREELGKLLEKKVGEEQEREEERQREANLLRQATQQFISSVVLPAFEELTTELERRGRHVYQDVDPDGVSMTVTHEGFVEFKYSVKQIGGHPSARVMFRPTETVSSGFICPPGEDYRDYTVADTTKEDIIQDFIRRIEGYVEEK